MASCGHQPRCACHLPLLATHWKAKQKCSLFHKYAGAFCKNYKFHIPHGIHYSYTIWYIYMAYSTRIVHSLNKLCISAAGNQWRTRCTLPPTVALISYLPQLGGVAGVAGCRCGRGREPAWSLLRVETISYANVNLMSRWSCCPHVPVHMGVNLRLCVCAHILWQIFC